MQASKTFLPRNVRLVKSHASHNPTSREIRVDSAATRKLSQRGNQSIPIGGPSIIGLPTHPRSGVNYLLVQRTKVLVTKKEQAQSRALCDALASLGYPGFANVLTDLESEERHDPAVVLLAALSCDHVDQRVVEALPWLVLSNDNLDWEWIIREARRRRVQNRLGYIVCLALRVCAGSGANMERLSRLSSVEERLFEFRLDKEDTLCRKVPDAERKWLRDSRPTEARQWNLLTDLRAKDLSY